MDKNNLNSRLKKKRIAGLKKKYTIAFFNTSAIKTGTYDSAFQKSAIKPCCQKCYFALKSGRYDSAFGIQKLLKVRHTIALLKGL
jgi:hypothetical protein